MKEEFKMNTWVSRDKMSRVRAMLRKCPDEAVRGEGLACLKGARPGYLSNLIPGNHPDRVAALKWIVEAE
jgi:hypothetical protein